MAFEKIGDAGHRIGMIEHIHQKDASFSAQEIGDELALSRITARRYLEYLEEQGMVSMSLNYHTGGRPKQLYHVVDS